MLRIGCIVAMILAAGLGPSSAGVISPKAANGSDASIHRLGPDARSLRFEGEISSNRYR